MIPSIWAADRVDRLVLLEWQEDEPAPVLDALMPQGLPPAAVLVVRRVAVVAAPVSVPSAVAAEVADASRLAARPVAGAVDPAAEAALFADEAELLACYLVAIRARRLGDWIWSQLASMLPPPVVDAVVGDPAVPLAGVVVALEEWRCADAVLGDLLPAGQLVLLHALAVQHDLWVRPVGPPAPAPTPSLDESGAAAPTGVASAGPPAAYDVGRRGSTIPVVVVTGAGFVSSVVSLVELLLGRTERRSVAGMPVQPAPVSRPEVRDDKPAAGPDDPEPRADVPGSHAPTVERARDRLREDRRAEGARSDPQPHGREGPPVDVSPGPDSDDAVDGVRIGLAGMFYLVNVYTRLDLRAFGLVDAVPWDVVDGLARAVVEVEQHDVDPVWLALQALAGRSPGEPPAPDVLVRCATAMSPALDDLALEPGEPTLAELVAVPGRLVVDRTHVEVFVALDAVDLAVRRRALDADPGWVPSLGRVIRFHFVEPAAP